MALASLSILQRGALCLALVSGCCQVLLVVRHNQQNHPAATTATPTVLATTTTASARQGDANDDDNVHYNCTHEDGRLISLQQVPAFIIIGAQKAGTSAMYDLLNLHPSLQGSIKPEAHFFDRRLTIDILRNNTNQTWTERFRCKVRNAYATNYFDYQQLQNKPHLKFFDKTPGYFGSTGAPFRIQAITPWSKIILSLRNPVDRAFSQHRMETRPSQPHLTFEERLGMSTSGVAMSRKRARR